ncbi:MAG: hypothetical protein N2Z23_08915 [Pyrinomonadaceae bacterium]|nr:hypothetical protein [Pyrinomonadaceae bacterium]MCX7640542.1 hypothetical protein [Pyrinomonadaceae bacterium]MDW8303877.1 hypothetical protein [Acidobacteriota bacterium]
MNYLKFIFALVLSLYFLWVAYDPLQGSFLDLVNLPIHETGHLIFRPFGEFLMVAGGSLFQVIMPALFVVYFWRREDYYSASIVLFWVGQSILNVYVYANDAVVMQLVLITGYTGSEGSFHDWNYLLTRTGLIGSTKTIANLIRLVGTLIILIATALSIFYAFNPTRRFSN